MQAQEAAPEPALSAARRTRPYPSIANANAWMPNIPYPRRTKTLGPGA